MPRRIESGAPVKVLGILTNGAAVRRSFSSVVVAETTSATLVKKLASMPVS